ncbi:Uncharacterised protein [Mycobacteroides abscessus subsp. abscessus]|nr:Uncharacterised protein [Mycobacteroides abscessus subsp. abscessus]SIL13487.1 Uncharacterised protein [Mycobacteroides abscessus subsp. abscessus]SIM45881.1 Uncharacterised protein [Mycobacteroides abscessus subsp. abscessus]SLF19243.1 Uncharacterised protein [Mycobacteroides abscessus subsp. abscessus]
MTRKAKACVSLIRTTSRRPRYTRNLLTDGRRLLLSSMTIQNLTAGFVNSRFHGG